MQNPDPQRLIRIAHDNITRIKGREYAPTSVEIQAEIDRLMPNITIPPEPHTGAEIGLKQPNSPHQTTHSQQ